MAFKTKTTSLGVITSFTQSCENEDWLPGWEKPGGSGSLFRWKEKI